LVSLFLCVHDFRSTEIFADRENRVPARIRKL